MLIPSGYDLLLTITFLRACSGEGLKMMEWAFDMLCSMHIPVSVALHAKLFLKAFAWGSQLQQGKRAKQGHKMLLSILAVCSTDRYGERLRLYVVRRPAGYMSRPGPFSVLSGACCLHLGGFDYKILQLCAGLITILLCRKVF